MRKLFYIGLIGLLLFEIAAVFFIMPFPGSQEIDSLGLAYFLYSYRWFIRIAFGLMIVAGLVPEYRKRKWLPSILILLVGFVVYFINAKMQADVMFHQPEHLTFAKASATKLPLDATVIAVENNGEAKAFPIRYIAYHHQVRDKIGGKMLLVTYCSVCRSGFVFVPVVDGKEEEFRLVGMDHFNAMFEDQSTGSWWRQATGEAVTGEQKGKQLALFDSRQMSLGEFFARYPNGSVMDPDPTYAHFYDDGSFENGKDTDDLTRTDTASWKDKSWVVGVLVDGRAKAYDWNELKKQKFITDTIGDTQVLILLQPDQKTFRAFRQANREPVLFTNDSLDWSSESLSTMPAAGGLMPLPAYQVYWHTWRTFYPGTTAKR